MGASRERRAAVSWTARAARDLQSIGDYVAHDNPRAAMRLVERLIARGEAVAATPEIGRMVPEFGRPDIREVITGHYRIVYQVSDAGVRMLTVFEGHRQIEDIPDDE